MILDHNFATDSISIDKLIDWLKEEKKGGGEYVLIAVSHLYDANDSELEDIGAHEETSHIGTVKIQVD